MNLHYTLTQLLRLAESSNNKELTELVLELTRELTLVFTKFVKLKLMLDEIIEDTISLSDVHSLTKIELEVLSFLRSVNSMCIDINELVQKLGYSTTTVILALKRLKKFRYVDFDVDVDKSGKVQFKV